MATTKAKTKAAAKVLESNLVRLEESRHGTPRPTYYLVRDFVKSASHREVAAAVYRLAAQIEEASGFARWCVQPDTDRGCVALELSTGDAAEVASAMGVLRLVERA